MNTFPESSDRQPAEAERKGAEADPHEQRSARLLQSLAENRTPFSTDGTWEAADLEALAELIVRGLVAGEIVRLEDQRINGIHSVTLKPAGRAWLAEAAGRKLVVPRTGLIRHNPFQFYLWFIAIVAVLYLAYHYLVR